MPKNIDDIVVPSNKKSIRSIPIPENRRQSNASESAFRARSAAPNPEDGVSRFKPPFRQQKKSRFSKRFVWSGAVVAVIILAVAIFSMFSGATVSYTPKSASLSFSQDTYTAYKSGDKVLLFSVIKLSEDKGVSAPASGEENASVKASGTIIVYNNNSKSSQKLVQNTRFETTDGKVYRIPNAITVPGQTTVNGALVPGSIETTAIADQPGADYNIDLSDFTIPGFKGDPRFTTMYARSKTPMSGGFVGTRKKVSDADLATATKTLEGTLKTDLMNQANAQVPPDFIIYPNLVNIVYSSLPQTTASNGATVNEHADLYGVMFKKADLANFLASKKLTDTSLEPVEMPDLSNLDLSFVGQSGNDLLKADQINFQVAGTATAVSLTDEESLKKDLAGQNKSDLSSILKSSYPGVLSASAVIRPFWKSVFPTDSAKIKIVENKIK